MGMCIGGVVKCGALLIMGLHHYNRIIVCECATSLVPVVAENAPREPLGLNWDERG